MVCRQMRLNCGSTKTVQINVIQDLFMNTILQPLLTPVKGFRKQYLPLLLIYFAYGAQGFVTIAITFWEKDNLTLSTDQLLLIGVWVSLPWTMKVLFGPIIDSIRIMGSARKIYVLIGALLVALQFLLLAAIATKNPLLDVLALNTYQFYLLALIMGAVGFVIQDLTADAMTTEVIDREGKTEEEIKTELAMVQLLGRLSLYLALTCVAGLSGYVASQFSFAEVMLMALWIPLLSVIGVVFLSLKEVAEKSQINYPIILAAIAYIGFSLWMAFGQYTYGQEISFIVSASVLSYLMWQLLQSHDKQTILKVASLMLVVFVFRSMPSTGPGFSWFSIDELGFDEKFFGVLKQLEAIIAISALWLMSSWIVKQSIKKVYLLLIFLTAIISLPEIILYYGLHETVGLSARTVALVDIALESPLANVAMVPLLAMIAYYASAGKRATWFAVATSMMNLALTTSAMSTKYLNRIYEVNREIKNDAGEIITMADYSQLGELMIVKTLIGLIVPLLFVTIFWRNKKQ